MIFVDNTMQLQETYEKIVPFQCYFSRDQPKTLKSMFYTWFGSSYFHTLSTQNLEVAFFWERITFQGGGGMMPEECICSFFTFCNNDLHSFIGQIIHKNIHAHWQWYCLHTMCFRSNISLRLSECEDILLMACKYFMPALFSSLDITIIIIAEKQNALIV